MSEATAQQVTVAIRRARLASAFPGRRPMGSLYSYQLPETRVLDGRDGTRLVQLAGSWIEYGTSVTELRGYLKRAYGRGVTFTEAWKAAVK